jgi:4-amino-4-deoxy-L-arabinose transferase-like glycosyltransferase
MERGAGRFLDSRWTVPLAAAAAFLLRLPGLTRPIRADEAGFVLVARAWDPRPDSLYGPYFVDRPPPLIALFKVSDAIAGPLFIRVLGAVACALLVVTAAGVARRIADERAARWTAVAMAAFSTNVLIDAVAVKGELLALPVLMGSLWLSLVAVAERSSRAALAAGLLAGLALGLKQNLVGGLVFAGAFFLASWVAGRLRRGDVLRLCAAALAGLAVPLLATAAWAIASGVRLSTLWYAVYGFRADATQALATGSPEAPTRRAVVLLLVAFGVGIALVIGGFVVHIRAEWAEDAPLTFATATLLATDLVGLVLGGSFWRDYLFPLLPATALCAALLARRSSARGTAMRAVIAAAAVSSAACLVGWVGFNIAGLEESEEVETGEAIHEVAEHDDTLVVFGGRADLQISTGLPSPYRQLWSLPMRTLDPDLTELQGVLSGPEPATWLVEWVPFDTWSETAGSKLEATVRERYVEHGTGCGGRPIWLLRGVDRDVPAPVCH